jgi:hypothetical protein
MSRLAAGLILSILHTRNNILRIVFRHGAPDLQTHDFLWRTDFVARYSALHG